MENQAEPRTIAGTKAPPFPRPVIILITKANSKLSEIPVKIMVMPMTTKEQEMTILVPYLAAKKPPMRAKVRYPRKFPVPRMPD
jgi:hypothetical protein